MSKHEKIEDFAVNLRKVFHYPKINENRYERRTTSTVDSEGNIWSLISFEEEGQRKLLLRYTTDSKGLESTCKILADKFLPSRPFIIARDKGRISASWIEIDQGEWKVVYAEIGENGNILSHEYVHISAYACMHPTICIAANKPYVIWAGCDESDNSFAIYSSVLGPQGWSKPRRHSNGQGNCFRPAACSNGKSILIAWDQCMGGLQHVMIQEISMDGSKICEYTISRESERVLYPQVAVRDNTTYSIACIAISDIVDEELGIVDHSTGIVFSEISNGIHNINPDWIAYLNEGLLGIENYTPYFGIRRKCSLVAEEQGSLWLLWEMRFEKEREDIIIDFEKDKLCYEHYGYLVGERFNGQNWEKPVILHQGGTCYSVAGFTNERKLGIAYLDQANVYELPYLKQKYIDVNNGIKLEINREGETRWNKKLEPEINENKDQRYFAVIKEEKLNLYWADTHVHSNFSPDAEGEPDELIHFGRDIAGLDVMAMVDNDYYPHAGLMSAEWLIQRELARVYTVPGKFVVFPGYEFTCHEKELEPNFNHRYVIFPEKGLYFSRLDPETRDVKSLARKISKTDGIMVAHHPSWKLTGEQADQFVEVCSSWRISIEEKNFIKKRLLEGQKFAFIGSSDTHRACPGLGGALTGIFAEELEPKKLFEAYKKRRTIATQGLRILIDFRIGNLFIGDEGIINKNTPARIKVVSPEELEYIEVFCDDRIVRRYERPGKKLIDEFIDPYLFSGQHFYYVRVKAIGDPSFNEPDSNRNQYSGPFIREGKYSFNFARAKGPFAWSTPIWVSKS
ncbi:MAG TPA: hypothetical protein GXX20_06890 [Clostridiaceae bacterium]|nr:hypothetical protein [Clostridiaceae bacterium]